MTENQPHFADYVTVTGNISFDGGDFYVIQKENSTLTIVQRSLAVGDNVTVTFENEWFMTEDYVLKVYAITDIDANRVVLRERSFSDFGVNLPNHSLEKLVFTSENDPVPTLEKASAKDIAEWDAWVYRRFPNLILYKEK